MIFGVTGKLANARLDIKCAATLFGIAAKQFRLFIRTITVATRQKKRKGIAINMMITLPYSVLFSMRAVLLLSHLQLYTLIHTLQAACLPYLV